MKRGMIAAACLVTAIALGWAATAAEASRPQKTTFITTLNAREEVPHCEFATNASRGVFVAKVIDAEAGTVAWLLVANNLPGETTAAHIHLAPAGEAGPVVQPLAFDPGAEGGVIAFGTFTNPELVEALGVGPASYYVNVHTGPAGEGCPSGVIRGQLG